MASVNPSNDKYANNKKSEPNNRKNPATNKDATPEERFKLPSRERQRELIKQVIQEKRGHRRNKP
jgi:hypothetical protein